MSITFMTAKSSQGHQILALSVILAYGIITAVSLRAHGERNKYHKLTLRAVSLLREAARSSLRADKGGDCTDVYADAARARIYVSAVDRLLTSEEVSRLTGVSLDELRNYVDVQLSEARNAISTSKSTKKTAYTKTTKVMQLKNR
jgi:hypothetical protein